MYNIDIQMNTVQTLKKLVDMHALAHIKKKSVNDSRYTVLSTRSI